MYTHSLWHKVVHIRSYVVMGEAVAPVEPTCIAI